MWLEGFKRRALFSWGPEATGRHFRVVGTIDGGNWSPARHHANLSRFVAGHHGGTSEAYSEVRTQAPCGAWLWSIPGHEAILSIRQNLRCLILCLAGHEIPTPCKGMEIKLDTLWFRFDFNKYWYHITVIKFKRDRDTSWCSKTSKLKKRWEASKIQWFEDLPKVSRAPHLTLHGLATFFLAHVRWCGLHCELWWNYFAGRLDGDLPH